MATTHRLRRRDEFAATVRGGRRAARGSVVVHLVVIAPPAETGAPAPAADLPARPGTSTAPVRAGFVVPRAVGGAVVRNLVRRRLQHLVAERLDRLPPGADLVVRAVPAAANQNYVGLGSDLDEALARALRPRRPSRPSGGSDPNRSPQVSP